MHSARELVRIDLLLAALLIGINHSVAMGTDGGGALPAPNLPLPEIRLPAGGTADRGVPFRVRLLDLPSSARDRAASRIQLDFKHERRPASPAGGPAPPSFKNNYHSHPPSPGAAMNVTGSIPLRKPAARQDSTVPSLTQDWVKQYSSGLQASNDVANAIAVDGANNVYVVGISDATYSGGDYLLIKYTEDGGMIWTARYENSPNSYNEPTALAVDSAGNVYVTGYGVGSGNNSEYITVKYDRNGVRQWVATHDASPDSSDVAMSIALDPRGFVYVAGYTYRGASDLDYLTVKYSSGGVEQWSARYDGPAHGVDVATKVMLDTAGNVYVTGLSQGIGTGYDYSTVSYNDQGVERWTARYNSLSNGDDIAIAMTLDCSSNVIVTGSSNTLGSGYDYVTVKYSSLGETRWTARYNGPANGDDEASDVVCDAAGGVYITGRSLGSGTHEDFATIRYTPQGSVRWVARFDNRQNGPDIATGVAVGRSGNIFVTGYSRYRIDLHSDYATVVYDSVGALLSYSLYNGTLSREDLPAGIVVDDNDNAYVTGASEGNQFDFATVKYVSGRIDGWPASYTSGAGGDLPAAMSSDRAGNVYVTGSNSADMRTIKFDSSGTRKWVSVFDVLPVPVATDLSVDGSGNVYVTGYARGANGKSDMIALKYDGAGVRQWFARYDGPTAGDDRAVAIAVDAQQQVYITGTSHDPATGDDYLTIKYDAHGTQRWTARYNGSANTTDTPAALAVDKEGNVYVTGSSIAYFSSNDYATIKYDSTGVRKWVAYYDGPGGGSDFASAMALGEDGAVYVTGKSFGGVSSTDYATVKYTPLGEQQWVARFNGAGNGVDAATAIAVDSRNDVFVTGYSYNSSTSFDYATLRYDPGGLLQWARTYDGAAGGVDRPVGLIFDRLGNVFVTGTSLGAGTGTDFATVEYDADGVAQSPRIYNDQYNLDDEAVAIAVDSSGGAYVAGVSAADSEGSYFVIKYTSNGAPEWPVRYDGPGVSFDVVNAMVVDSAGNVYITGGSFSESSSMDFLTVKYNPAGAQLWSARYGGIGQTYEEARAIVIDRAGNVTVTGLGFNLRTTTDYLTVQYSPEGVQRWAASFNRLGGGYNFARAIAADSDMNVYVTGFSYNGNNFDYTTVRYSSAGQQGWLPLGYIGYDGPSGGDDVGVAIALDRRKNIYVTGYSVGSGPEVDYATVKYSNGGGKLWAARYDGPAGGGDRPKGIALDSAGNVYVTGSSLDTSYAYNDIATVAYTPGGAQKWVARRGTGARSSAEAEGIAANASGNVYVTGDSYDSTYTYSDFATICYDTSGTEQWVSLYDGAGHSDDVPAAIKLDKSGNIYVAGASMNAGHTYDIAAVKYRPDGHLEWDARYNELAHSRDVATVLGLDGSGGVYVAGTASSYRWQVVNTIRYSQGVSAVGTEPLSAPSAFTVYQNYPNPFNPRTTIRYVLAKRSHVRVTVYDVLGRALSTPVDELEDGGMHSVQFDAGRLSSGVYFYRVLSSDGHVDSKKMMVIR